MRRLIAVLLSVIVLLGACASDPPDGDEAAQPAPTAATTPTAPPPTPTSIVVPTTDPTPVPPTATATAVPPAATAVPPAATANVVPAATATAVPPAPTATAEPPRPTSAPAAPALPWVNPDCYVGPGAADEPVWWCGGRICVVGAPHYGCPTTPPVVAVQISCVISPRRTVYVNEQLTFKAVQKPSGVPVQYAFDHGDGTLDRTSVSYAYYRAPGVYTVTLRWQHAGGKGTTPCGTVTVVAANPSPTISCVIEPRRPVAVNEQLVFRAVQNPTTVPVQYVFDHGDGTLDRTSVSYAYYRAPGVYTVTLRWQHAGGKGTTPCGTVTVVAANPVFNAAEYLNRSLSAAQRIAMNKGFEVRITRIDDQIFPGTTDYRLDRVNFEIDNDIVTKATVG